MCRQFVQCTGESILVTGMTFGESEASALTVSAFAVAFLGSVALWWIYFDIAEGLARMILSSSEVRDGWPSPPTPISTPP